VTGLDPSQLKALIVGPVLQAMGLYSTSAVNLVTGTALAESKAAYLVQSGGGPALGLWQMEPATHDDCWVNFLDFFPDAAFTLALEAMLTKDIPSVQQLVGNLRYACGMARIRYYRASPPLPNAKDAAALSAYHKANYNSALGAANAAANVVWFEQAIAA